MQDEQMDHIIREAAEKHHPDYADKAWQEMNQLLDKHLPEEKPKRRFLLLWALLILVAGGAFFTIIKLKTNKPQTAGLSQLDKADKPVSSNTIGSTDDKSTISKENNLQAHITDHSDNINDVNTTDSAPADASESQKVVGSKQKEQPRINGINQSTELTSEPNDLTSKTKTFARIRSNSKGGSRIRISQGGANTENKEGVTNDKGVAKIQDEEESNAVAPVMDNSKEISVKLTNTTDTNQDNTVTSDTATKTTTSIKKLAAADSTSAASMPLTKKKVRNAGFGNNFALLVSTGTDLSFIKTTKLGKATILYGASLGYNIKRFTVRGGFYVSDKIYTAGKNDYYIDPAAPVYFRGELQYINADCKVYEIPLQVTYNFGKRKNHNWFAGAGISSVIMKTETYDYFWKNPLGTILNKAYTYSNENEHFLSTLTLSGGYKYSLNKRIFVMAEPYLKLPLTGIGAGKIKLNSGGVLLTAGIRPFGKK